ncbi:unnamed protein product, partial [marine sediment metagenome]
MPNINPPFEATGNIGEGDGTQQITNNHGYNRIEYHSVTLLLTFCGDNKTGHKQVSRIPQAYREASQQAKNILFITVSVKLSAVYNVAMTAKEQAKAELPQTSIEVLDSYTATATEGFIALAAARAAAAGKSLAEVIKAAEEMMEKASTVILLDTMRHVYRSGRIPKVASQAASILNIRPILTISSGAVRFIGAVRN